MGAVKWIKIVTDIFNDEKILLIESLPASDSLIVIWFKLLCLAGSQNNSGVFLMSNGIPYTDTMLATIFRREESTVKLALKTFENFGMIEIINDTITIPNWEKHQQLDKLELVKEQTRKRVQKHRDKQKMLSCGECNVTPSVTVTQSNADRLDKIRLDIDKNKYSTVVEYYEQNIGILVPTTAEALMSLVDENNDELIKYAIDICCEKNVRNMSYLEAILKDWKNKGYKKLSDVQNEKNKNRKETESFLEGWINE